MTTTCLLKKQFQAHTRAQTRAADAAKVLDDPIIQTTFSDDQTEKSIEIPFITTNTRNNAYHRRNCPSWQWQVTTNLPLPELPSTLDWICVTSSLQTRCGGRDARHWVDAKKLTKTKAVLIVKFLTPQSLNDSTMQMYCTDLEPKRGLGQGADLIIRTAIRYALPQAKSLYDIGVRVMSAAYITRAMVDFDSIKGESIFDATQVDFLHIETLEQNHKGTIFDRCVFHRS